MWAGGPRSSPDWCGRHRSRTGEGYRATRAVKAHRYRPRRLLCTLSNARISSGCSAAVAHMLWEPFGPERRWLRRPERGGQSGEGLDYCAVRKREPWVSTTWEHLDSCAVTRRPSEPRVAGDERHREDLREHHERRVVGRHVVS